MIQERKKDHITICLHEDVESGTTGLEKYRFVHCALPEIRLDQVDTRAKFLGKKIAAPLLISSMTGGTKDSGKINQNLATAAEQLQIPFCVGSMRAAVEHPQLGYTYQVRNVAPTIPLLANLGLVQLNYGFGLVECQRAVDLIGADALIFHLNSLQEAVSKDGDTNFSKLLAKLEKIISKLSVPVVVKEVGFGISRKVTQRLKEIGVKVVDVAGRGGTNWALVEAKRSQTVLGERFADWGIPTADALVEASKVKDVQIIASGGIRSGSDVAKSLALGASMAGMALPLLKPATESAANVQEYLDEILQELRIAMFCIGAQRLRELRGSKYLVKTT